MILLKQDVIAKFQLHATDQGSSAVQIALLSERIKYLTEHFKENPKDKHSRLGLLNIIRQRQKLLKYLKKTKQEQYYKLIEALGLRDKK